MSIEEIGCCGAYCKTCRIYPENICKGCKIGYKNKDRDIEKAKCKMKVCCIKKELLSCADCKQYESCEILQGFYKKNGYKYKKYKEALEFIRKNGYKKFIKIADTWTMQYGKYKN
jgi:hypothetical protein